LPPQAAGRRGGGCEGTSRSGKGRAALCNPPFLTGIGKPSHKAEYIIYIKQKSMTHCAIIATASVLSAQVNEELTLESAL